MAEPNFGTFLIWSIITVAIMLTAGFAYKAYSRRKQNEESSS